MPFPVIIQLPILLFPRQTIFSVTLHFVHTLYIKRFKFMDITLHTLSDFKTGTVSCLAYQMLIFRSEWCGGITLIFNIATCVCVSVTRETDLTENEMA